MPTVERSSILARSGAPAPHLQRLPDWPTRLAAYLDGWRARAWAWGDCDCAMFAAGAVHAITGRRVEMFARWWDADSAIAMLRAAGGLIRAVDRHLPRTDLLHAQRGDVVLVRGLRHRHLAVVDVSGWLAPGASGLARGPMTQGRIAWGVGHG